MGLRVEVIGSAHQPILLAGNKIDREEHRLHLHAQHASCRVQGEWSPTDPACKKNNVLKKRHVYIHHARYRILTFNKCHACDSLPSRPRKTSQGVSQRVYAMMGSRMNEGLFMVNRLVLAQVDASWSQDLLCRLTYSPQIFCYSPPNCAMSP